MPWFYSPLVPAGQVQSVVLPKYGFEGSRVRPATPWLVVVTSPEPECYSETQQAGVYKMMAAMGPYAALSKW